MNFAGSYLSRRQRSGLVIRRDWLRFQTITVFLLPSLTIWTFSLGGELMLSDIAVAILVPILLLYGSVSLKQPYLKPLLGLLGLWLASAIVSDVINGSTLRNMMRGWASCIFFGLHLITFFVLINGQRHRCTAAIIGVACATLLQYSTGNSAFSSEDLTDTPWKMGNGLAVTVLFTAFLSNRIPSNRMVGQILLLLSPIHLFFNARSLFLTTVLSGLASAFGMKANSNRSRAVFLIAVTAFSFVTLPVAETAYGQFTTSGVFGEEARAKYEMQTGNGQVSILLGGRTESLISLRAIADAPVFGHGSWAESKDYYLEYLAAMQILGKPVNWGAVSQKTTFLIPSHSMLLSAWVYHGILGAAFWFFVLVLTLRATSLAILNAGSVSTLELLVLFVLLWDIFFSPFGQARRCTEAVYIVTVCVILLRRRVEFERKG